MKVQSSYIFLKDLGKQIKKEEKTADNVIRIDITTSVYFRIVNSFSGAVGQNDDEDSLFYKRRITWEYSRGNIRCPVEFLIYEVADVTYIDVVAEGKTKAQAIQCLEYIQMSLQHPDIQLEYTMIISYDAVSEYYCNKIYPKLNELERNLRKLLFNIYIVNFGRDYYKATISADIQNKAKGVIQAKGSSEQKESARLKKFFYSLEFNDIQKILFTPNWTELDMQAKEKFLLEHDDLSRLTDGELREAFSDFIPKSDWDRFFSNKITGLDVQSTIELIRGYRNSIAHCKFFYREDYLRCRNAVRQLNEAILGAIQETEEKDFAQKNSEAFRKALSRMKESLEQFHFNFSKSIEAMLKAYSAASKSILPDSLFENMRTSVTSAVSASLKSFKAAELIPPIPHIQTPNLLSLSENYWNENQREGEDNEQNIKLAEHKTE